MGEDFGAVYDFGKVIIYPKSSNATEIIVQRQDFKLMFDNWQKYIDLTVRRKDLLLESRVTTYTISIIHEFLVENNA
jgi:hypothetical protein